MDAGDNGPVTIHWFAVAAPGASIRDYRWVLDPLDLFDETPRTNELTDVQHWSARSVSTTGATLGPFTVNGPKPQPHLLFIEAEDSYGLVSLGIVRLSITHVSFSNELLFVDDTRLMPDMSDGAGGVLPPTGAWPTAAELDTFLFARGGVPWRGRAPGTLSTPGIFNGYAYDTLGTRGISLDGSVPSTSASIEVPSRPKRTITRCESSTTWSLVTMVPSLPTRKPVPEPLPARIETTAGLAAS